MNLAGWLTEVSRLLNHLKEKDLGYPQQENFIQYPIDKGSLSKVLTKTGLDGSSQLAMFYELCDGVSLPDVWNGYFIHTTKLTLRSTRIGPVEVVGPDACKILVFGSDGGGGLFALQLDGTPRVLYLPSDGVTGDVVFDSELNPLRILSRDFFGFLERLLADFNAFIEGRQGWQYMI